jgi:high-affinity iron transporter
MLGSLLVTLREGFEAALVVGIVLAYLRKSGATDRVRVVWLGVAAAAVVSVLAGTLLFVSGHELKGSAEKICEGGTMLLAATLLTWMIFWMRRQASASASSHGLHAKVSSALVAGTTALFWVAFVAVAREGIETALFLFAAAGKDSAVATFAGGLTGLVVAVALGVAVYRGGRRLNLRLFFNVTGLALLGFSAYLLYGSLHEFGELAGSELLEIGGIVGAVGYVLLVVWLYLRPPAWLARPPAGTRRQIA